MIEGVAVSELDYFNPLSFYGTRYISKSSGANFGEQGWIFTEMCSKRTHLTLKERTNKQIHKQAYCSVFSSGYHSLDITTRKT